MATSTTNALRPARKRALIGLAVTFLVIAIIYAIYWFVVDRYRVETDNAYVQGNVIQITPQVGGTVIAINADDTDHVNAGASLVRLDPADARVALEQAEAQLAQTVREVRTLYTNNSALAANVTLREAEVARAESDVVKAEDDVARRQPLVETGAVGREEFRHAGTTLSNAKAAQAAAAAALAAAREQLAGNQSLTEGTDVANHPNVLRAAARVHEAYLTLKRCDIPAPVAGYVAKRSVQVGQRVQAGTPMMAIIPLQQVWVEANFKESQLRDMRIGQPVELTADMYGGKVDYTGKLEGLGAGTGAAFALLPAQNATGNWIKIVQRLPVRIVLDPEQVAKHPLRVGLSMTAIVDIRDQSGKSLADASRTEPVAQTAVYADIEAEAGQRIEKIIKDNLGSQSSLTASETLDSSTGKTGKSTRSKKRKG